MTDRDENVARHYRALGNEAPPPELDRRILAAAREAVAPRRAPRRWAVPASLAAVLVLALGITLRMQMEKPGIEVSVPASEYSLPPAVAPEAPATPAPAPPAPAAVESGSQLKEAEGKTAAAPSPQLARKSQVQGDTSRAPAPRADAPTARAPGERAADAMTMPDRAPAPVLPQPEAKAFADRALAPSAAPPMAPSAAIAPAAPPARAEPQVRARRELGATAQKLAKENPADPRERELARIAELRREGRHGEADEALKKFRAEHPDYRIPEATWEQVKPR